MDANEDETARRAAAVRKQLKRMFREPLSQAYDDEDGGTVQVDKKSWKPNLRNWNASYVKRWMTGEAFFYH